MEADLNYENQIDQKGHINPGYEPAICSRGQ